MTSLQIEPICREGGAGPETQDWKTDGENLSGQGVWLELLLLVFLLPFIQTPTTFTFLLLPSPFLLGGPQNLRILLGINMEFVF